VSKFKIPSWKVNLVEEKGWERWDSGGDLMNWASDTAWDDFRHTSKETCADWVSDILGPSHLKRNPLGRPVDDEDLVLVCDAILDGDDRVENTHRMIVDSLQWMYEEAAMPRAADIEDALEMALDGNESWSGFSDAWDTLVESKQWSQEDIMKDLLSQVSFVQKPKAYDRFLVFDFGESKAAQALISTLPPPFHTTRPIRFWSPERTKKQAQYHRDSLERDLEVLKDDIVADLFRELVKVMDRMDLYARTDWDANWKNMLSDKNSVQVARDEIFNFLKAEKTT
jgi:hypothetical protein